MEAKSVPPVVCRGVFSRTMATPAMPVPSTIQLPHQTPCIPLPLRRRARLLAQTNMSSTAEQVETPLTPSSSCPSGINCANTARQDCTSRIYGRRGLALSAALQLLFSQRCRAEFFNFDVDTENANKELAVRSAVRKVLSKAKAAGVLRLAFHDAGTFDMNDNSGGMNGSVVLELDRLENVGLSKSVKVLEKAKQELVNDHQVSWADLIAVAGAEAVALCGGPTIPVLLGRIDTRSPDPEGKLPEENLNASELKNSFMGKGFLTQELVALSGAHTLGGKGFGNPVVFDNTYYKVLLEKPWMSSDAMSKMVGLQSDHALAEDEECLRWITTYAADQVKFFDDFRRAYIKLVNSGASWRKA